MNTEQADQIKALLQRYSTGQCTLEEQQRVERWLGEIKLKPHHTNNLNEEAVLKRIRKGVLDGTQASNVKHIRFGRFLKIAAAILLIPTIFFIVTAKKQSANDLLTYSTKRGETKMLTLPDSSIVMLNASSTITLSSQFNNTDRKVALSGEAFFQVKHNVAKPFIVSTGAIHSQDLGTMFNVHAYPGEDNYKITVVDGKVQVLKNVTNLTRKTLGGILTSNRMLSYNLKKQKYSIKNVDAGKISSWQYGSVYFDDATATEIIQTLSRKYNVDMTLLDKPEKICRYTIGFKGESLDRVLKVLNQLTGLSYEYSQKKILIHLQNCR